MTSWLRDFVHLELEECVKTFWYHQSKPHTTSFPFLCTLSSIAQPGEANPFLFSSFALLLLCFCFAFPLLYVFDSLLNLSWVELTSLGVAQATKRQSRVPSSFPSLYAFQLLIRVRFTQLTFLSLLEPLDFRPFGFSPPFPLLMSTFSLLIASNLSPISPTSIRFTERSTTFLSLIRFSLNFHVKFTLTSVLF